MLTRRSALAVLPAGAVLDASLISSAQAQSVDPPKSMFPAPDNKAVLAKIRDTRTGFTVGIETFALRTKDPKINKNFDVETTHTLKIFEFLMNAFEHPKYEHTGGAPLKIEPYKPDGTPHKDNVISYYAKSDGSGVIDYTTNVVNYLLSKTDQENTSSSDFYKRLRGLKDPAEFGWPGANSEFTDVWKPRTMALNDLLTEAGNKTREISSYLLSRSTVPNQRQALVYDILFNNDEPEKKLPHIEYLYPRADALWRAGYDAASISPLAFPLAVQAYSVYYFLLKIFNDPRRFARLQNRARARVMERISGASDFFDFGLSQLKAQSTVVRQVINGLRLKDRPIYLGCDLKAEYIADLPPNQPGRTIQNPAIPLAKKYARGDGSGLPDWDASVQIFYTNYYLKPLEAGYFDPAESDDPFYFVTHPVDPSQAQARVAVSQDVTSPANNRNSDLNDLYQPALVSRLSQFIGVADATNKDSDPFDGAPPTGASGQSSNQNNLKKVAFDYIKEVKARMDEVKTAYEEIQVYFNCMERMSWSMLQMLTRGGA